VKHRILLTGKDGQVGSALELALAPLGDVVACNRSQLDLSDPDRIRCVVRETAPSIIINAAAYTAVDKAESEPEIAAAINGRAPGILAEEAKRMGALLVHYSTDYVFDGTRQAPYRESDAPNPLNVYGRTKLAGEEAIRMADGRHLILRTTWVYAANGHNFMRTMLRLAAERDELRVVDDQIGAPTWSGTIAEGTAAALRRANPLEGVFHLTAGGATSWFGFAQAILDQTRAQRKREPRLIAIPTSEYPLPARRPANSRLDCSRFVQASGYAPPSWQDALHDCLGARSSSERSF
jgi:dTDP-4-dehydrorhamnose reductase